MKKRINDDNLTGFRKLPPLMVEWLKRNNHTMTNADCAMRLKLKEKTLINYAFRLDLKKSPEHISRLRKLQAINTNKKRWKK